VPEAPVVPPAPPKPVTFRDGEAAYHAGNFAEATAMFTRLTEEKPGNAWGHYMLGLSASKSGDVTTATKAFDEALRIDPKHVKTLINSARLLIDQKQPGEALPRLDHAVMLEPDSNAAHRLFGRAYHAQGKVDEAIAAYERALELDPDDSWSLNNLGLLLFEQGRAADAVPLLTRAVELRKDVALFSNNLGMALEHTGQFQAAASSYRNAVDADPSNEKAKKNLARVEGRKDARPTPEAAVATPTAAEDGEARAGLR
jgi:superkiller protein 3